MFMRKKTALTRLRKVNRTAIAAGTSETEADVTQLCAVSELGQDIQTELSLQCTSLGIPQIEAHLSSKCAQNTIQVMMRTRRCRYIFGAPSIQGTRTLAPL
jgi:hypothetical protein